MVKTFNFVCTMVLLFFLFLTAKKVYVTIFCYLFFVTAYHLCKTRFDCPRTYLLFFPRMWKCINRRCRYVYFFE
ncbi:Lipid transfer protein [Medicago truncatula]|uniref:Lipid transfer protein n=1 Tax=Medicago truncatula TaxID=3880 RepID=A0A072UBP2_MEDTR|nr:Lipid transfer protein [Medicago truncatula]